MPAFSFSASSHPSNQAFAWVDPNSPSLRVFTYSMFLTKLRVHLARVDIDPKAYAALSFRRGGASFAYQSGIPLELTKALGDWRSDTILIYLTMPLSIRLRTAHMFCKAILTPNPHT